MHLQHYYYYFIYLHVFKEEIHKFTFLRYFLKKIQDDFIIFNCLVTMYSNKTISYIYVQLKCLVRLFSLVYMTIF